VVKTYTPKTTDVEHRWWLVDAEGEILGRLATRVASVLRGKHKVQFSPHADVGDHVVVVNAARVAVTGNRMADKLYRRHSGYPGGLREETMGDLMARRPERVVRLAVEGMLPHNRLGRHLARRLTIYAGPDHPHQGQAPTPLALRGPVTPAESAEEASE
jgi:large subunit ribosomal protein L13